MLRSRKSTWYVEVSASRMLFKNICLNGISELQQLSPLICSRLMLLGARCSNCWNCNRCICVPLQKPMIYSLHRLRQEAQHSYSCRHATCRTIQLDEPSE